MTSDTIHSTDVIEDVRNFAVKNQNHPVIFSITAQVRRIAKEANATIPNDYPHWKKKGSVAPEEFMQEINDALTGLGAVGISDETRFRLEHDVLSIQPKNERTSPAEQ